MSQEKFFNLLEKAPRIRNLWDKKTRSLNVNSFEEQLGVMSSGEVAVAKFFASVWFNDNKKYGFDLVDVVSRIDVPERKLIIEWMCNPFWP